jgi:hypothetical protein
VPINTISNLGTGAQVFAQLVNNDAQFRSIAAGAGITVAQNTGDINVSVDQAFAFTWTAAHNFGTPTPGYVARFDPAHGDFYIDRSDNLSHNPISGEINGFAADITQSNAVTTSLVPLHGHAVCDQSFEGNAWGIATEAINAPTKHGGGTQLFGGELSVINQIYTSTAWRHCGALVVFKNRPDATAVATNGVPPAGAAYNKTTFGIYIDTGAGRIGSSTQPTAGNAAIECGWQTGIYFDKKSLDTAGGAQAVGIDMTPLDNAAPEGGKFIARVKSALAVPNDLPITLATNFTDAQVAFNGATGNVEFRNDGSQRFAANQSNGTIYTWDGVNGVANQWFLDMVGTSSPTAFFNFRSSSRIATTATPGDAIPVAPAGYLRIRIDGVAYKLAYYRD